MHVDTLRIGIILYVEDMTNYTFVQKMNVTFTTNQQKRMVVWGRAFATPIFKELLWFYRILQKFCLDALYETVHALTGPCAYVSRR